MPPPASPSRRALSPQIAVTQDHAIQAVASGAAAFGRRQFQSIYGFSVYNPGTGEAYLVEVVDSDLTLPDQLPDPTQNVTYDPYYVRVVFLSTLTCYNMSIIVPSMVHDQYGNWAYQDTAYTNVLSKTNELSLGYMYSLYDGSNNFDDLDFSPYPAIARPRVAQVAVLHLHQHAVLHQADGHLQSRQPLYAVC